MIYKDHYIWHNNTRLDRPWMLQQGYSVIGTYRTLSAAKGAATRYYNIDRLTVREYVTKGAHYQ